LQHTSEAKELQDASSGKVTLAVRLSFIANCLLAVLQIYAAASSLSLSLFAVSLRERRRAKEEGEGRRRENWGCQALRTDSISFLSAVV